MSNAPNDPTHEHGVPWNADDAARETAQMTDALLTGQQRAADAASWWTQTAAMLAKLRDEMPLRFPSLPAGHEEWFEQRSVPMRVDLENVLAVLDSVVASADAYAGEYRRQNVRLIDEGRAAGISETISR